MFLPGPIHRSGLLGQGIVEFLELAIELIEKLSKAGKEIGAITIFGGCLPGLKEFR
jgi:hypothetical protein